MGAIWGLIDFNENHIKEDFKEVIEKSYSKYKVDRIDYLYLDNLYMGCGIQNVTKEMEKEVMPRCSGNLTITGDCILYNKQELGRELNIKHNEIDSEFLIKGYEKWGNKISEKLVGDYSFGIFNWNSGELYLSRDHVGKECVYYYFKDNILIFSTLINTIVDTLKKLNIKVQLNEKWISTFLALDGMFNEYEVGETQFEDIYIVPPATYMVFKKDGYNKKLYWNPLEIKKLKLSSHEEYMARFREIFKEAVSCRMRGNGKLGVQISGGLDSSSVASVASSILGDEELLGYNFAPNPKYDLNLPKYLVGNEMEFVNELTERYKNFKVKSLCFEGEDSFKNIDELIGIIEGPYKIVENFYWMKSLIEESKRDECRVLLNGQYGNCTISFGSFNSVASEILNKKPIKFLNELKYHCKKFRKRKINLIKRMIKFKLHLDKIKMDGFYILNEDLIKKYKVNEVFKEKNIWRRESIFHHMVDIRESIVSHVGFSHLGVIENKMSLYTGVALRDPTRDKRVIEFCLSIPVDVFICKGRDRLLVRDGLKDIVPEKVRENFLVRGFQSADWINRLYENVEEINCQISLMLNDENFNKYIDVNKVFDVRDKDYNETQYTLYRKNEYLGRGEIRKILISLILYKYLGGI